MGCGGAHIGGHNEGLNEDATGSSILSFPEVGDASSDAYGVVWLPPPHELCHEDPAGDERTILAGGGFSGGMQHIAGAVQWVP